MDILENPYVRTTLSLFLGLYAGLATPKLPKRILDLMQNNLVRVAVLGLVAYMGNKDPRMSLMIAIAFVVTLNIAAEQKMKEHMTELDSLVASSGEEQDAVEEYGPEGEGNGLEYFGDDNQLAFDDAY